MDEVDATVVHSLKKVAKGSVLVLIGSVIYYLSQFLFRVILARGLSVADYGAVAFSLAVVNVVTVIALLGLPAALPRQISYYRSKGKNPRVIAAAGLLIAFVSAVFLSLVLVFFSGSFSFLFLGIPADLISIFCVAVLFTAILRISNSISRGYEDISVIFWFQHVLYGFFVIIVALIAGLVLHSAYMVAWLYLFSIAILSALSLVYVVHKGYLHVSVPSLRVVRSLLAFSIPLFLSTLIGIIFTRMDTFMIGYFMDSAAVGLYNVATTVVTSIPFFLNATSFLYLPVATSLMSSGNISALRRVYQVITKWIVVFTVPLFLIVVFYPGVVINFFFGSKYVAVTSPLVILAFAYLIHTSFGANGWTLIALGENKFFFRVTVVSAVINFALNALLIPIWGISGAAVATAAALIAINVLVSARLYLSYRLHPFTRHYFIPFIAAIIPLILVRIFRISAHGILALVTTLVLYLLAYGLLLLIFRIFEKEDVELLRLLERRLGLNLGPLKSFLRHFL